MRKRIKGSFRLVVLILVIIGGLFLYQKIFTNVNDDKNVSESNKVDSLEKFNYALYDNSTSLYKNIYYELKEILEKKEIDYDKYAELVSELFVSDFYTLSNKVTNKDIGGLDFIYSKNRENFALAASETIYNNIESNVYGNRHQDLPQVVSFGEISVEKTTYNYKSENSDNPIEINDDNSYIVKINWQYDKDLGYPTSATLRLVHEDKALSIVSIE